MSPVYDCTTEEGRAEGVAKAVEAVRAGEVVVLPTDTVYGVGADAFSAEAVAQCWPPRAAAARCRRRSWCPACAPSTGWPPTCPPWARDLIGAFWPGPLTLVFKAQSSLMWDLGETNGTVALRMPQDDIALAVLTEVGPMAVTSANLTGQPAATTVDRRRRPARRGGRGLPRRRADARHRGVDDRRLHRRGAVVICGPARSASRAADRRGPWRPGETDGPSTRPTRR